MNSNVTRSIKAADMVFPPTREHSIFADKPRTRQEVLQQIYEDTEARTSFELLLPNEQESLL